MQSRPNEPRWIPFISGSIATCTAEAITMPLDTLKNRTQLKHSTGMFNTLFSTISTEGLSAMYGGLGAGLTRQFVYQGIKFGTFEHIRDLLANGHHPTKTIRFMAGGLAGCAGMMIANPADLIKTRMQCDNTKYRNFFIACRSIYKQNGCTGLYTGISPSLQRAFLVNAIEVGTYDSFKNYLVAHIGMNGEKVTTQLTASILASIISAIVSQPLDVCKTRLMTQSLQNTNSNLRVRNVGNKSYKGLFDCFYKSIKSEGILGMYQGLLPSILRLVPWCMISFVTYEHIRSITSQHVSN